MTQLILDGIILPESQKGGYQINEEPLHKDVTMVSGRLTRELRGHVWHISYQFGYFGEELKNQVLAACKKGRATPISCGFLPQESSGELSESSFLVINFTPPKFMWSRDGSPLWGDYRIELREVRPHD